jgi:hypothetical protein
MKYPISRKLSENSIANLTMKRDVALIRGAYVSAIYQFYQEIGQDSELALESTCKVFDLSAASVRRIHRDFQEIAGAITYHGGSVLLMQGRADVIMEAIHATKKE